ncbi:MAG: divalent-cation tolerance protein CutA [Hyphomicrobiaceae bacterium]
MPDQSGLREAVVLVYATCPDVNTAREIAHQIVGERLAACANILPGMEAVYRWDDKVEMAGEVVVIFKTLAQTADRTVARIVGLHPYDVPAALIIPVTGGSDAFLDWVSSCVAEGEG